ncbi:MAG: hypothetical protein AAFP88_03305, partial [Bacteroidota bacterium]
SDSEKKEVEISFPQCAKVISFKTSSLMEALIQAFASIQGNPGQAIALEPEDTSFDAADMIVLHRLPDTLASSLHGWCLYLLQDTIARKHSLHPIKILSYCASFGRAFSTTCSKATPKSSELLERCEYIAVVPRDTKDFQFEEPSGLSTFDEVDNVAELLGVNWPVGFSRKKPNWSKIVKTENLIIPPTSSGKPRSLNKTVVANALLIDNAKESVLQRSRVVFDVLYA